MAEIEVAPTTVIEFLGIVNDTAHGDTTPRREVSASQSHPRNPTMLYFHLKQSMDQLKKGISITCSTLEKK